MSPKQRKIAMMGYRSVGKFSLSIQFVEGQFVDSYDPTIENTFTKSTRVNSQDYELKLIDTAGQDEYSIFPSQYSIDVHGYVLVYSITSQKSFEVVKLIYEKLLDITGKVHVPIVLVGNKTDLHLECMISTEEVDTTSQYDAIRAYLKELDISSDVWIGLSRSGDKRNFTWRDFRALSSMDYWQEAIPTGNDPLCAAMDPAADFRWHALSCGGPAVASFICELPVPSWASGPHGCLLTELPSLTVLYIPEQSAVELTSDCGLGGTKRIACKGNSDRDDMMRRLACTDSPDLLDDKTQSPISTTMNQDSTYANTNTEQVANSKTTKPWIWTSNTIDTGDYTSQTRHRRETIVDTMNPGSTQSTGDFTTKKVFVSGSLASDASNNIELLTTDVSGTTITVDLSTMKMDETTETQSEDEYPGAINQGPLFNVLENGTVPKQSAEAIEEYPSAISQGQLFSIIENGTMFDIIELNETDDNKITSTSENKLTPNPTPSASENSSPLFTTVIYHKEPTDDAVTMNYKNAITSTKTTSKDDLSTKSAGKTLTKEIAMFPITSDSLMTLNRTNRKELPMAEGVMKPDDNINLDVDNNLPGNAFDEIHKTVEVRIEKPGRDEDITKSSLFVTTRRYPLKNIVVESLKVTDKGLSNDAKINDEFTHKVTEEYTSDFESTTAETNTDVAAKTQTEDLFDSEPTSKPNRQRQLTRPQRRSFYPYFFSRVLG